MKLEIDPLEEKSLFGGIRVVKTLCRDGDGMKVRIEIKPISPTEKAVKKEK